MNRSTYLYRALALAMVLVCTGPASAQSEISRKIIHLDSYSPTPGDVYSLVINYGINVATGSSRQSESNPLLLETDYTIEVPYIGRIDVRNLTYEELRRQITSQVKQRALAQFVSLSLSAPAVFDVFVWGAVATPGFHTVTSLNRLTDVIAAAGGVQSVGSRRRIEIATSTRNSQFDLVRYVAGGDERQNPFVQPGDRVHVPTISAAVQLGGAVVVGGMYEVLEGETIGDLIEYAGGLLPTAKLDETTVTRINDEGRYTIIDLANVDLTTLPAEPGDIVTIPASTVTSETVQLEGALFTALAQEGTPRSIPMTPVLLDVPYTPGLTLLRLLERFGGPTPFADADRSFIIRKDGQRAPVPDLGQIWELRQWERDIVLQAGDHVVVPMQPLIVSVGGQVIASGSFPYTSGYTVGDYIAMAGGLDEENAGINQLYFAESDGTLTRVDLETEVPIGARVHVGRSAWAETKQLFSDIFTVTGWVTGILGVATAVVEFIRIFVPTFPFP